MKEQQSPRLIRELGVFSAVMMGLGSIVGTGVFVSIGIGAGVIGPAVILAIAVAAIVATCNALSSAQLAASHPVSGGTFEYGYKYLHPVLGFSAGWTFLCAKSASAATAALGFSGYFLQALGANEDGMVVMAVTTSVVLTIVVISGLRRTNVINISIVSITLITMLAFVLCGLPLAIADGRENLVPFFSSGQLGSIRGFLYATALMFVAFTGYGRIATLGEEVREPKRTIPRAIVITVAISTVLYIAVAAIAICVVGAQRFNEATLVNAAPLEVAAREFGIPNLNFLIAVGAMTAMLGVLLNLILGLSRVMLAMGRRGDMPAATARLNESGTTPTIAVIIVGIVIAGLCLIGSVKTTWSFSAFKVLIYYAITNLAALKLPPEARLYSPIFAWCGLIACVFLACWVQWQIWLCGIGMIAVGLIWHFVARRIQAASRSVRM